MFIRITLSGFLTTLSAFAGLTVVDQAHASETLAKAAKFEQKVLTIETAAGKEQIYTEVSRGRSDRPAFLLLNGLVYGINRWNQVSDQLAANGETVIRFAYSGQPENLKLLKDGEEPKFFASGLTLQDLANEVNQVVTQLHVGPRVHVVGLSYGSSVASEFALRHPDKVESLILLSPLVVPLETYDITGHWFRAWLNSIRFWENSPCDFYGSVNPYLCSGKDFWFDSFYNYYYDNYLTERIEKIPTGVDEANYKKSVFHLVRAARDFDLRGYAPHLKNVYMVQAADDDVQLKDDQDRSWAELAKAERRALIVVRGVTHALPDEAPIRTAELLSRIADRSPSMQEGKRIEVSGDEADEDLKVK